MSNWACHYTNDVKLAAALLTLGARPHTAQFISRSVQEGREVCYFQFEQNGVLVCGKSVPEIMKLWLDETRWQHYEKTNPESVLCYIRAAFHNRERMLDVVKLAKKVVMVKDKVNAGQYHLVTK